MEVVGSPLMNATDTTNGYVLDKAQIEEVPLATGSFTGLALLSPGVNAELPSGTGSSSGLGNAPIWANGQRDTSNSFSLNGVDGSNLFNGKSTSQVPSARVINSTGVSSSTGAGGVIPSSASVYLSIGNAIPTPVPDSIEEGMQEWEPSLLAPLASSLPAEDVQLYYQMALMGRRDLAHAPDPQTGFEMTLLRMLAFRPATDAAPTPGAVAPAAINRQTASTSTRTSSARSSASPTISPASLSAAPLPRASASPEADSAATLVDENDWQSLVKALKLSGAALQLAANCVLRQREGSVLRLLLDPTVSSLRTPACEERLTVALSQYFKTPMRLDFVAEDLPASAPLDTPARRQAQAVEERLNTARADLETDPTVRALKDKFGGALQADSVRPLL